jgi:hypothetical protein
MRSTSRCSNGRDWGGVLFQAEENIRRCGRSNKSSRTKQWQIMAIQATKTCFLKVGFGKKLLVSTFIK